MLKDKFGFVSFTEDDLLEELYKNPDLDLGKFKLYGDREGVDAYQRYKDAITVHYEDDVAPEPVGGRFDDYEANTIHRKLQNTWFMPKEYYELDIAQWVIDQCGSEAELQRVGEELLMFQERDMMDLLRYLKYFVDTMREHNIVWGVGRGSSVASYVLFLIGVHKVDSIFYNIPIGEFLRPKDK